MYEIEYLPVARKDLFEIVTYIAGNLNAPKAAVDLLDEIEKSILKLKQFPFRYKVYYPMKGLQYEYRLLPVKNYAIFYIVKESTVEIHRILYSKMNLDKIIKQK